VAEALGLQVIGALGAVAAACRQGQFGSFEEAVGRLRAAGLHISLPVEESVRRGLPDEG
jgi:predicted nucleic acid-binding protein